MLNGRDLIMLTPDDAGRIWETFRQVIITPKVSKLLPPKLVKEIIGIQDALREAAQMDRDD